MKIMFYEKGGRYGTICFSDRDGRYRASTGFEMSKHDKLQSAKNFMKKHGYIHNPKIVGMSSAMPLAVRYKD